MSTPVSVKRQLRTSHPTPPEKTDIKKHKSDFEIDEPITVTMDPLTNTDTTSDDSQTSLTEHDIQRIAAAVENRLFSKLNSVIQDIVDEKTKPLESRIHQLENQNVKLTYKLDDLEQYGRRSLV